MNRYKLDIYKVIEGTDKWPLVDTIYGATEQECSDEAFSRYGQDEYHWTWPVETSEHGEF